MDNVGQSQPDPFRKKREGQRKRDVGEEDIQQRYCPSISLGLYLHPICQCSSCASTVIVVSTVASQLKGQADSVEEDPFLWRQKRRTLNLCKRRFLFLCGYTQNKINILCQLCLILQIYPKSHTLDHKTVLSNSCKILTDEADF